MSFIMRCDACNKRIDPDEGETYTKDPTKVVELQTSDDPSRRRHYHHKPECWGAVKDAMLAAEEAAQDNR